MKRAATKPTLTPTYDRGATGKPMPMVYVPPERGRAEADMTSFAAGSGLNGGFLADLLSDYLQHERCGVHLYRSLAQRTLLKTTRRQYKKFGDETQNHVRILHRLITALGGDPNYVSPAARATEKMASSLLEGTFLLGGSVDEVTNELVLVDAVLLAEARDHANWKFLGQLASEASPGSARDAIEAAVREVEPQEDEHAAWAENTRSALATLLAQSAAVTSADRLEALTSEVDSRPTNGHRRPSARSAAPQAQSKPAQSKPAQSKPAQSIGEKSRDELYEMAKRQDIPGRSTMSKDDLLAALKA
jgi:rubrerythrin